MGRVAPLPWSRARKTSSLTPCTSCIAAPTRTNIPRAPRQRPRCAAAPSRPPAQPRPAGHRPTAWSASARSRTPSRRRPACASRSRRRPRGRPARRPSTSTRRPGPTAASSRRPPPCTRRRWLVPPRRKLRSAPTRPSGPPTRARSASPTTTSTRRSSLVARASSAAARSPMRACRHRRATPSPKGRRRARVSASARTARTFGRPRSTTPSTAVRPFLYELSSRSPLPRLTRLYARSYPTPASSRPQEAHHRGQGQRPQRAHRRLHPAHDGQGALAQADQLAPAVPQAPAQSRCRVCVPPSSAVPPTVGTSS